MKLTDKEFKTIMYLTLAIVIVAFVGMVCGLIMEATSNVADVYSAIASRTETVNAVLGSLN